ncbi:hypothetical protein N799_11805 [Lysobacter arseniciresistens ZS79]|uniref:DUF4124 domain-containing protein n=2 Tax=Novilysobacter TaxID=3382699 RepID=A0A0A0EWC9_9GAMM|nr:hypothetical protein N799_11805 [Lysobacter arseniciresistens ZS79]
MPMLALLAAASAAGATPAPADEVTIYRCVAADGRLTLRDTPCADGERQQAREMLRPQDPPPQPKVAASPASPPPAATPATPRITVVHAPPPSYECTTPDGDTYVSHDPAGNPRWVPAWTLGYPAWPPYRPQPPAPVPTLPPVRPAASSASIGNGLVLDGIGRPTPRAPADPTRRPALPPAVGLALTPGAWIRDSCQPLPQAVVCERLRDRHWELGRRYNSALQSERHAIDDEQRGINARLAAECAA